MTRPGGLSKIRALARILAKEEEGAEANRRQAQSLARKGRGGDTEVAHVTPGEIIIPQALQTPEVMYALAWAASSAGLNLDRLRVGAHDNAINPKTGAPEFSGTLDENHILPTGAPWKNSPYAGDLPAISVIGQRQIPGPFPMPEIPVPGRLPSLPEGQFRIPPRINPPQLAKPEKFRDISEEMRKLNEYIRKFGLSHGFVPKNPVPDVIIPEPIDEDDQ